MGIARAAIPSALGLLVVFAASAAAPVTEEIRDATVAMGFDARTRCPDLMQGDAQDGTAALVLFVVGPTGVPSRASIKSTSGSANLDAAAVDCVLKLRFLPMVHAGDGNAISSWQEIAWKWGRLHSATPTAAPDTGAVAGVTSPTPQPVRSHAGAEVRVCVDASGRLVQDPDITRSSGDSALDAATLRVARSAAAAYPAPGCMRLTLSSGEASANERR